MRTFVLVLVSLALVSLAYAQTYVPTATEADYVLSKLDISRDGKTVTIRSTAPGDMRICVAPALKMFGPTRCFVVQDIRKGSLTLR